VLFGFLFLFLVTLVPLALIFHQPVRGALPLPQVWAGATLAGLIGAWFFARD
jgi:hypothetical protein